MGTKQLLWRGAGTSAEAASRTVDSELPWITGFIFNRQRTKIRGRGREIPRSRLERPGLGRCNGV